MLLSKKIISDIKAFPIIEILGKYTQLKRNGNQYLGLCPFHNEKTPSFYVHPKKGYKCFGCDAKGGSAIRFIMDYEGKSYPEAIMFIGAMLGISMERAEEKSVVQFSIVKKSQQLTMVNPRTGSLIQNEQLQASLKKYEANYFTQFLIRIFGNEITNQLISRYYIGTSKYWQGATIFWQVDENGKIRTGKIMLYDAATGKRVKKPYDHINWVHTVLKKEEFDLKQCLFGEHLLKDNLKQVALTESEKTAVIASIYFPQFTWLATGSLYGLTFEKCQALKGYDVILFPDIGGYDIWNQKAKELSSITHFYVSDMLERKATKAGKREKLDIADYLLKFNYKDFINLNNK